MNKEKPKSEWEAHECSLYTLNFITGCINDCKYCDSKEMSIRYKRSTPESWKDENVRASDLLKKIKKYEGRVMFPSSHDIRPEHLAENRIFLKHILESGNEVLIVTKPNLVCIKSICKVFEKYKDKILFRFTIGSANDKVLKFWEPNAPDFKERLACLKWAHKKGFGTSVSCEPMLDNRIDKVIKKVSPYFTETIWIGKINHLIGKNGKGRLDFNGHNDWATLVIANELINWQSDDNVIKLYDQYKDDSKIMWKESIKKVIQKHKDKNEK
jgi:DNA repair photolyase